MCETLRVLNAVRFYEIGIPLSYDQFLRLTPENLIKRLINRREYLIALRISTYLRLPTDRIYVHWASQKVRIGSEDEDTICRLIVEKLAGKRGISFEEIARAAYDEGRGRLATELLNHEPRAGKQVPLLLKMEEDEIALDKAIESGDSDLILFVLFQLRKKLPQNSFYRVINSRPTATALIESSANSDDGDNRFLRDLYYQDDRRVDGANLLVREALKQPDTRTTTDKLASAAKLLSDSKDTSFEHKALQEATALLDRQTTLDKDLSPSSFTSLSLHATILKLLTLNHVTRAKKLQSEFKVSEKTIWWLRLRAQVSTRSWPDLEALAQHTRKSPIGWVPFFTLVVAAGNQKLAAVFIPKVVAAREVESREVVKMWERCGMRVKAAEEAVRGRDGESFERVREAAKGTVDEREIERLGVGVKW